MSVMVKSPQKTEDKTAPEAGASVDEVIGMRIRECRKAAGLSQPALAEKLGLAWQQVQKYERGTNRVSASRLHEIAQIFNVPLNFFFAEEVSEEGSAAQTEKVRTQRQEREIFNLLSRLDKGEKEAMVSVLKSMANAGNKRETAQ